MPVDREQSEIRRLEKNAAAPLATRIQKSYYANG